MTKEQISTVSGALILTRRSLLWEVYMSNLRKAPARETGLDKEIKTLRNVGYILQGEWEAMTAQHFQ